ncbi:MAG TPA: hypothetical protein VEX68_09045 [Bryobacteraceae bacterium]|nr:hypothetical protein [Bryobacteraceae bacterium]
MPYRTLLAVVVILLSRASAQLGPTVTGLLYNSDTRELRPVVGIPGSAFIGAAVATEVDAAWPAPSGKFSIVRRGDQTVLLTGFDRPDLVVIEDTRLLKNPSLVVWSIDAGTAVLYSSTTQQLQRIHLKGSAVDIDPAFEGSHLGSTLSGLVVHSDGRIAIAFDRSQIYIARTDEGVVNFTSVEGVVALGFETSGEHLYVMTDSSLKTVNKSGGPTPQTLVDGLANPVGMAVRPDGIYIATSGDNKIRRFNRKGQVEFEQNLDRKPDGLSLLQGDAVLLLNNAAGRNPAVTVDTRNQPFVFFIPNSAGSSL